MKSKKGPELLKFTCETSWKNSSSEEAVVNSFNQGDHAQSNNGTNKLRTKTHELKINNLLAMQHLPDNGSCELNFIFGEDVKFAHFLIGAGRPLGQNWKKLLGNDGEF